jgi:hypothetical protein
VAGVGLSRVETSEPRFDGDELEFARSAAEEIGSLIRTMARCVFRSPVSRASCWMWLSVSAGDCSVMLSGARGMICKLNMFVCTKLKSRVGRLVVWSGAAKRCGVNNPNHGGR